MAYRLESEMAPDVAAWLRSEGLAVKSEFQTPWGVCDFVGVSLNEDRVRDRVSLGQTRPIGPLRRVAILNKIPDEEDARSISVARLSHLLSDFVGPSDLARELEVLRRNRFVRMPKKGLVQRVNGWAPLHERIVAVELKLHRVQEALAQASRNLGFAEESYVALPEDAAHRVESSKTMVRLQEYGIGLLGVSPGRCEVILRSEPESLTRANPVLRAHCVERFWRTRSRDIAS